MAVWNNGFSKLIKIENTVSLIIEVGMVKSKEFIVFAICIFAVCSCGSYQRSGNQTGKFRMGMDKDRTHRYEEGQQRRIDEDKMRRVEMDRNKDSKTGSIRYFLY